jgi:LysM repeat protein
MASSSTAPRDPIRLRPVTITAIVLAVAAFAVGAIVSRRVDDSASSSTNPPAAAPAPSVWDGGVELIVYMAHGAPADDIQAVRAALLDATNLVDVTGLEYLDTQAVLAEAQRLLADDPNSLAFLTKDNVPTMFKVVPAPGAILEQLVQFSQTLRPLPGVLKVETPAQTPTAVDSTPVTATSVQQETSATTISGDAGLSATVHSEEGKYVIAARDYPSTIAKKFKVRLEDLLAINGWTLAGNQVPEFPVPGTTIRIPPGWTDPGKGSDSTTAGPGDTAPTTEPMVTVGGG